MAGEIRASVSSRREPPLRARPLCAWRSCGGTRPSSFTSCGRWDRTRPRHAQPADDTQAAGEGRTGQTQDSMASTPLERSLGLAQTTALVIGIVVGVSIFVQPTEVSRYVPDVAGIFGVWAAAGVLALCGALVCAELSSAYPRTGGVYVFLNETVSPAAGFLWGWAMFWCAHSGIIAAIAVIMGRYVGFFVPLGDAGIRLVAIGSIVVLSAVNGIGVRQGGTVQTVLTAAKLLGIVLILIWVAIFGPAAHHVAVTAAVVRAR